MLNTIEPFETRYVQRDGFIDIYTTQPLESLLEAMDTTEAHALGLTGQTLQSLRAFFDGKGHSPSPDHWLALWAIANTLEAMASGIAQPKIYLSAVDPGVGKTQTVLHFARHLVASVEHRGVGMLISAFTIAEVADIAKQLEGISNSLWVRTSDSQANALGGAAEANEAQILITTQAGLGKLTKDQTFAAADALYYRGEPRACRVWDESLLPGSTAVLESGAIVRMGSRFELRSQALYAALLDLGTKVRTLKENEAVDVPDLVEISGMPMEEIREVFSGSRAQEDTENALFLSIMSGRTVRARRCCRIGRSWRTTSHRCLSWTRAAAYGRPIYCGRAAGETSNASPVPCGITPRWPSSCGGHRGRSRDGRATRRCWPRASWTPS
jgi:hypothetical protein